MAIKYASEIMSELNEHINVEYSKHLHGELSIPENIQAFFASVIQDCKNIAFDNDCQVRVITILDDTFVVEILVFKINSIFLHCYIRQGSIYVTMYSTYDDRQVELVKIAKGFYDNPESKIAELADLRKKYFSLSDKCQLLERKLAAYNGSSLISTLKDIISQVEDFEQDKNDTSCQ